jgi:hypothetical protein
MKFSIIATILATASAQVTLVRPDKTTGIINSTPGCYGIYPDIAEVKNADNLKLEFYNDWNCKGSKVEESSGNKVFNKPVNALSIRVSPKSRARHLRAHHENRETEQPRRGQNSLQEFDIEDVKDFISEFLPEDCNVYTGIVHGCDNYSRANYY